MDYFIGYSQGDKIKLLKGLTETMLSGQITSVKTSRDAETQFKPSEHNDLIYARLCASIANSEDYDETDPVQLACFNNQRTGITRPIFC